MGELIDDGVLFQPVTVGDITLGHRVVLAPLTRVRANNKHVHTDLGVTYYAQRGSVAGTLLITEATFIAPYAGHLSPHAPGIYNEEQIAAWKRVGTPLISRACTELNAGRRCGTCERILRLHADMGSWTCCRICRAEGRESGLSLCLCVIYPVE